MMQRMFSRTTLLRRKKDGKILFGKRIGQRYEKKKIDNAPRIKDDDGMIIPEAYILNRSTSDESSHQEEILDSFDESVFLHAKNILTGEAMPLERNFGAKFDRNHINFQSSRTLADKQARETVHRDSDSSMKFSSVHRWAPMSINRNVTAHVREPHPASTLEGENNNNNNKNNNNSDKVKTQLDTGESLYVRKDLLAEGPQRPMDAKLSNNRIMNQVLHHYKDLSDRALGPSTTATDNDYTNNSLEKERRKAARERVEAKRQRRQRHLELSRLDRVHPCVVQGGCSSGGGGGKSSTSDSSSFFCSYAFVPQSVCVEGLRHAQEHTSTATNDNKNSCWLDHYGCCPWHHGGEEERYGSGGEGGESVQAGARATNRFNSQILFLDTLEDEEFQSNGRTIDSDMHSDAGVKTKTSSNAEMINEGAVYVSEILHLFRDVLLNSFTEISSNKGKFELFQQQLHKDTNTRNFSKSLEMLHEMITQYNEDHNTEEVQEGENSAACSLLRVHSLKPIPSVSNTTANNTTYDKDNDIPTGMVLSLNYFLVQIAVLHRYVDMGDNDSKISHISSSDGGSNENDFDFSEGEDREVGEEDLLYQNEIQMEKENRERSRASSNSSNSVTDVNSEEDTASKPSEELSLGDDRYAKEMNKIEKKLFTYWNSYLNLMEDEEGEKILHLSPNVSAFLLTEAMRLFTSSTANHEETISNNTNNNSTGGDSLLFSASKFLFRSRKKGMEDFFSFVENEIYHNNNKEVNKGTFLLLRWAPLSFLKDLLLWKQVVGVPNHSTETNSNFANDEHNSGNNPSVSEAFLDDLLYNNNTHNNKKEHGEVHTEDGVADSTMDRTYNNYLERILSEVVEDDFYAIFPLENKQHNINEQMNFCWEYYNALLLKLVKSVLYLEKILPLHVIERQILQLANSNNNNNKIADVCIFTDDFQKINTNSIHSFTLFSSCQVHLSALITLCGRLFQDNYAHTVLTLHGWQPWSPALMFSASLGTAATGGGNTDSESFGVNSNELFYYSAHSYARHYFPTFYFNFVNYMLNSVLFMISEEAARCVGLAPVAPDTNTETSIHNNNNNSINIIEKKLMADGEETFFLNAIRNNNNDSTFMFRRYFLLNKRKRHKIMENVLKPYSTLNLYFISQLENLVLESHQRREDLQNEYFQLKREYLQEYEEQQLKLNNYRTRKYNNHNKDNKARREGDGADEEETINSNANNNTTNDLPLHPLDRLVPHGAVALGPLTERALLQVLFETNGFTYKTLKLASNIIKQNRIIRHVSKQEPPRWVRTEKFVHKRVFSKKLNKKQLIKVKVPIMKLVNDTSSNNNNANLEVNQRLNFLFIVDESLVLTLINIGLRMREKGEKISNGLREDLFNGLLFEFYNNYTNMNNNHTNLSTANNHANMEIKALLAPTSREEIYSFLYSHEGHYNRYSKIDIVEHSLLLNGTILRSSTNIHTINSNDNSSNNKYAVRLVPPKQIIELLFANTDFYSSNNSNDNLMKRYDELALLDENRFVLDHHMITFNYYNHNINSKDKNRFQFCSFAPFLFLKQFHYLINSSPRTEGNNSNSSSSNIYGVVDMNKAMHAIIITILYCYANLELTVLDCNLIRLLHSEYNPSNNSSEGEEQSKILNFKASLKSFQLFASKENSAIVDSLREEVRTQAQKRLNKYKNNINNNQEEKLDKYSMENIKNILSEDPEGDADNLNSSNNPSRLKHISFEKILKKHVQSRYEVYLLESYHKLFVSTNDGPQQSHPSHQQQQYNAKNTVLLSFAFELLITSLSALHETVYDNYFLSHRYYHHTNNNSTIHNNTSLQKASPEGFKVIKQMLYHTIVTGVLLSEANSKYHTTNNNKNDSNNIHLNLGNTTATTYSLYLNAIVRSLLLSPLVGNNNSNNWQLYSNFSHPQIWELKSFLSSQLYLWLNTIRNSKNETQKEKILCFELLQEELFPSDTNEEGVQANSSEQYTNVEMETLLNKVKNEENSVWLLFECLINDNNDRICDVWVQHSFADPSLELMMWIGARLNINPKVKNNNNTNNNNLKLFLLWIEGILQYNKFIGNDTKVKELNALMKHFHFPDTFTN